MVFQEPKVEFVNLLQIDTTSASASGYTVCEKIYGINVGSEELCMYYSDTSSSHEHICTTFCDTTTSNEENNTL